MSQQQYDANSAFSVNPVNEVEVLINSETKGTYNADGKLLADFIVEMGSLFGLSNLTAYADGVAVNPSAAKSTPVTCKQINLVAKDARGLSLDDDADAAEGDGASGGEEEEEEIEGELEGDTAIEG